MATNEVIVKFKTDADGNLKILAQDSERAAGATERLAGARDRYSRREKGVAQASANSTKNFSKMQQGISGGLVPAYAALAANIFALTALFGALQRAARAEQLAKGLDALGTSSGIAMAQVSRGLQEATGFALSLEEAMRSTALITSAGLDASSVEEFGKAAKNAALALGRDTGESLERFTRGVTKLEPELLDELGIFVRVDKAAEDYARSIGKTAKELTNFEKRQAFANAALTQADEKFGALEDVSVSAYDKLSATFADLSKSFLNIINVPIGGFIKLLADNTGLLLAVMLKFASSISGQVLGSLTEMAQASAENADAQQRFRGEAGSTLQTLARSKNGYVRLGKALQAGTATQEDFDAALKTNKRSMENAQMRFKSGADGLGKFTLKVVENKIALAEVNKALIMNTLQTALNREEHIIAAIESGNFTKVIELLGDNLKDTRVALGQASKMTGLLAKALAAARIAAMAAAGAFKVLGAAISKILGPLSALIFVFEILKMIVVGFYKLLTTEAFGKFRELTKETHETLSELGSTFESVTKGIKGQSSVLTEAAQIQIAYGNALGQVSEKLKEMNDSSSQGIPFYSEQKEVIEDLMDSSEEFKKAMLDQGLATRIMGMNFVHSVKGAMELMDSQQRAAKQTQALQEAMGLASKATQEYLNSFRRTTQLDSMAEGLNELVKSIDSAKDIAEQTKIIGDELANNETLAKLVAAQEGATDKEKIRNLRNIIKAQQENLALTKSQIAVETSVLNVMKMQNIQSDLGIKIRAQQQNKILRLQIQSLNTERAAVTTQLAGLKDSIERKDALQKIREIDQKILELEEKQVTAGDIKLQQATLEIQRRQAILQEEQKGLDTQLASLDASEKIARSLAQIEAAKRGQGVGIEEQIRLETAAAEARFKLEKEAAELKIQMINAEYDLLDAQADARRAELEQIIASSTEKITRSGASIMSAEGIAAKKELDALNRVVGLRATIRKQLITAAGLQAQSNEDLRQANIDLKEQQRIRQVIEKKLDRINILANNAMEIGGSAVSSLFEQINLEAELVQLKKDRKEEEEGSVDALDNANKELELTFALQMNAVQAAQAFEQQLLDAQNTIKTTNGELAAAQTKMEILANTNPFTGKPISIIKAAKLADQERLDRIANAKIEADIKKANLDFEKGILNTKFILLEAELQKLMLEEGITEEKRLQIEQQIAQNERLRITQNEGFDKRRSLIDAELALTTRQIQLERTQSLTTAAQTGAAEGGFGGGVLGALTEANRQLNPEEQEGFDGTSEAGKAAVEAANNIKAMGEEAFIARAAVVGMMEDLSKLGPEGEFTAALMAGGLQIQDSLMAIGEAGENTSEKLSAVAGVIGGLASIYQAASQNKIAGIQKEIDAEKKRDGQSAKSVAKIRALEKKKEQQERKAFEMNKKMMIAQTIINTAAAVMATMKQGGFFASPLAMLVAAMGAAQVAMIASTSYQGGGNTPDANAPTSVTVGERRQSVDLAKSVGGAGELSYFRGARGAGGPEDFTPAFVGYRNRAEGGNTAFMVGEQGPEMFVPDRPGTIIPNDDIVAPTAVNATFNISTVDATGVEDLLTNQRGNIIDMIREAANANGEEFLETIRTSEL